MHALHESAGGVHPQGPAYLFPPRLTPARHHTRYSCAPQMPSYEYTLFFSNIFAHRRRPELLLEGEPHETGGAVILSHPVIRKRTLFHGGYKSREGRETTKNTSVEKKGKEEDEKGGRDVGLRWKSQG